MILQGHLFPLHTIQIKLGKFLPGCLMLLLVVL